MRGLDDHYRTLLAEYQGKIDQAAQEESELSPEDEAFMKSYMSCIAIGSENDVIEFLKHDLSGNERDVFMACHVFTSIEEAWFMWQDAIKFMKDKQK
jgi:hypothetical protein